MKFKSKLCRVIPYYKKYWWLLTLTIFFSGCYAGFSVLSPILEGNLLAGFTELNFSIVLRIAFYLMLLRILIEANTHIWSRVVLKLNSAVNFDLKHDMLNSLMRLQIKNFDYTSSGIFLTRINQDSFKLAELFDDVTDDLSEVLLNVCFIFYSFFLNPYLGLFLLLNVFLISCFISLQLHFYKPKFNESKEKDELVTGSYNDMIQGIRDIKNLNLKEAITTRIDVEQDGAIKANKLAIHTKRTWSRWRGVIQHILDFVFIGLSLYLIYQNKLTVSAFLIVFVYKKNIITMITSISNIREKITEGAISANRVFDIIDYDNFDKELFGDVTPSEIKGCIRFQDVSFTYENGVSLFQHLNLIIPENKMIALVGKSGEGKSTLLDLITKNYIIDQGNIYIDDNDIFNLSEKAIRENISVVSQNPYIFNLSIKDNIKLANPDVTDEEIISVCKKIYIHDFIVARENGYDTIVGENGITLSGGQKQRIAIARALIKRSKIILFDEATSALDNASQEQIKKIMKELSYNHTVIIVAHRLSTIIDADQIMVFYQHKIVATGTHQELMKNSKEYQSLYQSDEHITSL